MNLVNPLKTFGPLLNTVQAPSRYIGGEFGTISKPHKNGEQIYNVAMAFPDMYEIGMSNMAIKIIYNALNRYDDIRCELVFAPDTDFEKLLLEKKVPLYTLQTGMPLCEVDLLAFSIGYELGATEILAMLEDGKVPVFSDERGEADPIVIGGGCGATNPEPMSDFFDAVMIGEAEDGLFELIQELAQAKKNGSTRSELMAIIESKPFMWTKQTCSIYNNTEDVDFFTQNNSDCTQNINKLSQDVYKNEQNVKNNRHSQNQLKVARRAVLSDFGLKPSVPSWFPLPAIKPVQDHGVVEIMRGCPNGCRFCHAGIYYRPTRVKNRRLIIDEVDHLVFDAGYREISLNSLSSADFPDIEGLLDELNKRYKGYNISFQLPSLKVNSMSLPIMEKLSTVRKSGLTFAVETPEEMWQLSLNKEVYAQHLVDVIKEAKSKGWSSAKFYFMIGLPVGDYFGDAYQGKSEEEVICDFLLDLQARTRIQCNVNVGVFIPKPHTAYQWVRQISPAEAARKMEYIYQHLPRGKFKLGRHNYDTTLLEGLLSRGARRAGKIIYSAYKKGARFDAWDDHLRENMPFWNQAMEEAGYDVRAWVYRDWPLDEVLPWDSVSLGPSKGFYKNEWKRSIDHILTSRCQSDCPHPCGICSPKTGVRVHAQSTVDNAVPDFQNRSIPPVTIHPESNIPILYRIVFSFTRMNGGEYTAYLSQVETFHKAILRTGLPFVFTTGFNPLPRIEFATAMSLGLPSRDETATCYLYDPISASEFIKAMNSALPEHFHITRALVFPVTNLRKRETLSQGLWGGLYRYQFNQGYSADSFFNSQEALPFLQESRNCFFSSEMPGNGRILKLEDTRSFLSNQVPQTFCAQLPVSDKTFRTAIESFFGQKWYTVAEVTKLQTLAKNDVKGWTAEDEQTWRYTSKKLERKEEDSGENKDSPLTFMELYKRIAQINLDLIRKREELDNVRKDFYHRHPDVRKKHQKKNQ